MMLPAAGIDGRFLTGTMVAKRLQKSLDLAAGRGRIWLSRVLWLDGLDAFGGRVRNPRYKYYNMDQVVAQALAVYERIAGGKASETPEGSGGHIIRETVPVGAVGGNGVHPQPRR
jgi:hypothetical protein